MSTKAPVWTSKLSDQLLRRCIHEASHAAVARILEIEVLEVVVTADGQSDEVEGGHTYFQRSEQGALKVLDDSHLLEPLNVRHPFANRSWVATRAGGVGSVEGMALLGRSVSYEELMGDTVMSDDAELRDMLNCLPEQAAAAWVRKRYDETWALVALLAPSILAVAERLATDRALYRDQLDSILKKLPIVTTDDGSVLSEDDLLIGRAAAEARSLKEWPDKTTFLQDRNAAMTRLFEKGR